MTSIHTDNMPGDYKKSVSLNLMDVYLKQYENVVLNKVFDDQKVCRFCLKLTQSVYITNLYETKENMSVLEMISLHIPQLNLYITEELSTCATCLDVLKTMQTFILECLSVEEKLNRHIEQKEKDCHDRIEFPNKHNFKLSPQHTGNNSKPEVKQEICLNASEETEVNIENFIDDTVNIKIEQEEVDVKSEDGYGESNSAIMASAEDIVQTHKCCLCPYETSHKPNLSRHMINHKSPAEINMYKCELCPYQAKLQCYLNRHMTNHKVVVHECEICSYECKKMKDMRRHLAVHKDPFEMDESDNCSPEMMRKRILMNIKMVTHKCVICTFQSKKMTDIRQHLNGHKNLDTTLDENEESKDTKDKKRRIKGKLKQEIPLEMRTYKCKVCSYQANQRNVVNRHMLVHRR